MDRLSDLPKHILHNILSKMSVEDAVRTSALSKSWNHTWSTFPILNFEEDAYYVQRNIPLNIQDLERERKNFINHVEKTLKRFHDQGLVVREFKLGMEHSDSKSMNPRIDYWMRLAKESCVQELALRLNADSNDCCCLPPCVLEAKSLTKLTLWSLKIESAILKNPIQFSSLQVLFLFLVTFEDEKIIQHIISCCPLIEELTLDSCKTMNPDQFVLKSVRLRGLYKLKKFVAIRTEEIDVDAPNLEDFQYEAAFVDFPLKINVDKCRNLRGIDLSSLRTIIITNQWFFELFRKFHLLQRLRLHECMFSEKVKVSCDSLKVLEMINCLNLKEFSIDAPNLCSLKICTSVEMPILTFLKISSLTYFEIILRFIKYWDFQKLREFLQGFEYRDILASLSLYISSLHEFNPDTLRDISVFLPSIKHLNLITSPWLKTPRLHLVSGLLWSCCPATISIQVEHRISYSVMAILKKVLIDRKQDECCCSSSDHKCWWHGLKDVKLSSKVKNTGSEAYPMRLESFTFELEY